MRVVFSKSSPSAWVSSWTFSSTINPAVAARHVGLDLVSQAFRDRGLGGLAHFLCQGREVLCRLLGHLLPRLPGDLVVQIGQVEVPRKSAIPCSLPQSPWPTPANNSLFTSTL